jgi:hypothetical protein
MRCVALLIMSQRQRISATDPHLAVRVFWNGLCQIRMSIDPIDSIFLGSEVPEIVHGAVRPRYSHRRNQTSLS